MTNKKIIVPNIFHYATKELSQDAFLAWLFKWAEKQYNVEGYKDLHNASCQFIKKIIKENEYCDEIKLEEIKTVDIFKQTSNIDLWIVINNSLNIVIEDKTYSREHDNQLKTYKEKVTKWCKKYNQDYALFYYKLGKLNENEKKQCKKYRYHILSIEDINEVYKNVKHELIENYLFCHYKSECLDCETMNYDIKNIAPFYNYLQTKIKESGTVVENNELYFWFNNNDYAEYSIYYRLFLNKDLINMEIRICNFYKELPKRKYNEIKKEIEIKNSSLKIDLKSDESYYNKNESDIKLFTIKDKEVQENFKNRETNNFINRLKRFDDLINNIYVQLSK